MRFAADRDHSLKGTKGDKNRYFAVDEDTVTMLLLHFEQMDARAAELGVQIAPDPFMFSLAPDCSVATKAPYVTKQVAKLKAHLGIANKRPETIAMEDEALRLYRQPPVPRPRGRPGPRPKGAVSYTGIGQALGRSPGWAKKAIESALQREKLAGTDLDPFDGSIVALRKFTSSELLDAGFSVKVAASHQGHSPETLQRYYAQRRDSADTKAAEHLGRVVHRRANRPAPEGPDLSR